MAHTNKLPESNSTSLFWEPIAERRWGKYISANEEALICFADTLALTRSNALEIGAEGGRWSKLLSDLGWQMTCTDVDAHSLSVCQNRIPTANCILVDADSQQMPCKTASQRLLLAIEIHELVEQNWFIEEGYRVLETGGLFVGVFQNKWSWRAIRNLKPEPKGSLKHYAAAYVPWRKKLVNRGFRMHREVGLCWMPFGRMSDSRLIPAAVWFERWLGLQRLPSISPWIVFVAQKIGADQRMD